MRRVRTQARPGWRRTVESQGLVFPVTDLGNGQSVPYWFEEAYYTLTAEEVDELELVTQRLHAMCLEAARHLASGALGDLGLSPGALDVARMSLEANPPSLYGRFDLQWDGWGPPKLLEYNADTPTGLLESSVAQWYWLQDRFPEKDQWNSIHERLVRAWQSLRPRLANAPVYFAHHEDETSGEEWMTVTYLQDTAQQAGLATRSTTIGEIGYDRARGCFVGLGDEVMRTCFKLYPWELMLKEPFGWHVEPVPMGPLSTTWLEPPWKVLLSNKALLVALWQIYPDHDNLLPSYLHSPDGLDAWVAKPLHGREGAGIRINAPGISVEPSGSHGAEGWCYQQWCPLADFDGNRVVLGSWIIDGHPAGLGVRESDGWITDTRARFVPHLIDAAAPDEEVRAAWLDEDGTSTSDDRDPRRPAGPTPSPTDVMSRFRGFHAPGG